MGLFKRYKPEDAPRFALKPYAREQAKRRAMEV
jgi:hypothetical protein